MPSSFSQLRPTPRLCYLSLNASVGYGSFLPYEGSQIMENPHKWVGSSLVNLAAVNPIPAGGGKGIFYNMSQECCHWEAYVETRWHK